MFKYNNKVMPLISTGVWVEKLRNVKEKELCAYYIKHIAPSSRDNFFVPLCVVHLFRCVPICNNCLCCVSNYDDLRKYLQNVNFGDKSYK